MRPFLQPTLLIKLSLGIVISCHFYVFLGAANVATHPTATISKWYHYAIVDQMIQHYITLSLNDHRYIVIIEMYAYILPLLLLMPTIAMSAVGNNFIDPANQACLFKGVVKSDINSNIYFCGSNGKWSKVSLGAGFVVGGTPCANGGQTAGDTSGKIFLCYDKNSASGTNYTWETPSDISTILSGKYKVSATGLPWDGKTICSSGKRQYSQGQWNYSTACARLSGGKIETRVHISSFREGLGGYTDLGWSQWVAGFNATRTASGVTAKWLPASGKISTTAVSLYNAPIK